MQCAAAFGGGNSRLHIALWQASVSGRWWPRGRTPMPLAQSCPTIGILSWPTLAIPAVLLAQGSGQFHPFRVRRFRFRKREPFMLSSYSARRLPPAGLALLVGGLLLSGCGEKSPYTVAPVSGKVTYEDGSPIPGTDVQIMFVPQTPPVSAKEYPRPASGSVSLADGSFECMTTNQYGDGATVGPQKVLVLSINEQGKPSGAVPAEYANVGQTPLTADVSAGHGPYSFKIEKPNK
jgi:hypothetical protein